MQTQQKPLPRTPLHIEVEFKRSYARTASKAVLKNISLTGAFLHNHSSNFDLGEKISISFNVGNRVRSIGANVIWKNQYGCGIKFEHFNNRDRQIVDDLIYFVEAKRESTRNVLESILTKVYQDEAA